MTTEPDNQRVTLGILGEKIDGMSKQLVEVLERYRTDHDLLLTHSGQIAANISSLVRHEIRIEDVDQARKTESRIIAVMTAILAAFGIIWPRQ